MASQCLAFHGQDVPALIARIDASQGPGSDPGSSLFFDKAAAELVAPYLVGDVLRWYESLDTATQESWASLRAGLLKKFGPFDDNKDAESSHRDSCLVVQPARPPLTSAEIKKGQAVNGFANPAPLAETPKITNSTYTATIQRPQIKRRSKIFRNATPPPPPPLAGPLRSPLASHFIIDLIPSTPLHYRADWQPIEIQLPPVHQTDSMTYRIDKPIPLKTNQLNYVMVGFRLAEIPAPDVKTHLQLRYTYKSFSYTPSHTYDWMRKPVWLPSETVFLCFHPHTAYRYELKPGIPFQSSLTNKTKSIYQDERPQIVVEWQLKG